MIKVVAPDNRVIVVEASRATDLRAGVVAAQVPPEMQRLGAILRAILGQIGWDVMDPADRLVDARSVTVATARLLAAGVRHVVLVQSGWVRDRNVAGLVAALESCGIDLIVIAHPTWGPSAYGRFDPWLTSEWDWPTFAAWLAAGRALAGPRAHPFEVDLPIPARGIRAPAHVVGPRTIGAVDRITLEALRSGITAVATRGDAGAVVADVAGQRREALEDLIPAAVAALDARNLRLAVASTSAEPSSVAWRDLRQVANATAAAAVALSLLGIRCAEMIRMGIDSISRDGAAVRTADRVIQIPEAARPFLLAQCYLRAAETGWGSSPLMTMEGGYRCDQRATRRLIVDALRTLGWHLDEHSLDDETEADRRLAALGLAVEGEPSEIYDLEPESPKIERRCRHGLPWTVVVDDHPLSHSEIMCKAGAVDDTRRWASGYSFALIEETETAASWSITFGGEQAGTVWRVATQLGDVWLQSMERRLPAIDLMAPAVREVQRRRSFASAHQRRRRIEPTTPSRSTTTAPHENVSDRR